MSDCKTCGKGINYTDRQFITELKNRFETTGEKVYVSWVNGVLTTSQTPPTGKGKNSIEYYHIKEFNFV